MTPVHESIAEWDAGIATIDKRPEWVYARAQEIDTAEKSNPAGAIDLLLRHFRKVYGFAGVSSNNIYWNRTKTPARVICVPSPDGGFVTLINPNILKLKGKRFQSIEGCGSIPDGVYQVKRLSYVLVSGYGLNNSYLELEYEMDVLKEGDSPVIASHRHKGWVVQHEMDHLDGITIKEKGEPFDLNTLLD